MSETRRSLPARVLPATQRQDASASSPVVNVVRIHKILAQRELHLAEGGGVKRWLHLLPPMFHRGSADVARDQRSLLV
jgi:hypothetical protein